VSRLDIEEALRRELEGFQASNLYTEVKQLGRLRVREIRGLQLNGACILKRIAAFLRKGDQVCWISRTWMLHDENFRT